MNCEGYKKNKRKNVTQYFDVKGYLRSIGIKKAEAFDLRFLKNIISYSL